MNVYTKPGDQREEIRSIRDSIAGSDRDTGGLEAVRIAEDPTETAVRVDGQSTWTFNALRAAGWEKLAEEEWRGGRWQDAEEVPIS